MFLCLCVKRKTRFFWIRSSFMANMSVIFFVCCNYSKGYMIFSHKFFPLTPPSRIVFILSQWIIVLLLTLICFGFALFRWRSPLSFKKNTILKALGLHWVSTSTHQSMNCHQYPWSNLLINNTVSHSTRTHLLFFPSQFARFHSIFILVWILDWKITMVEKPKPENSPSNMAIIWRYILTPDIFNILKNIPPDQSNEVQITDALHVQAKEGNVIAYKFMGKRFDCGSVKGYVDATNYFANKIGI